MKDKIKEIYLSNLEWTKTHDNMGGVICNLIFKDNMSYDDYKKLFKTTYFILCDKDYITNLQEIVEEHKNCTRKHWQQKCAEHYANEMIYKSRIDKARGMIRFIAYNSERPLTITELNKVYNILGGDDNE